MYGQFGQVKKLAFHVLVVVGDPSSQISTWQLSWSFTRKSRMCQACSTYQLQLLATCWLQTYWQPVNAILLEASRSAQMAKAAQSCVLLPTKLCRCIITLQLAWLMPGVGLTSQ